MTWAGGVTPIFKGVRTFVLKPRTDGSTDFAMTERFSGLMLPLIKASLRYAKDLKQAAEGVTPRSP